MKRKSKQYQPPEPPGDYPLGGFVPGYVEQICPRCRIAFCGGKGSTECKRCAIRDVEAKQREK